MTQSSTISGKTETRDAAVKGFALSVLTLCVLAAGFFVLRSNVFGQIPITLLAVVWGTGAVILFFYTLNMLAQLFPPRWYNRIIPFVFVSPAMLIMGWYLLLPTVRSGYLSFLDRGSKAFVGFQNYIYVFTDLTMQISIRNTFLWLVFGTVFSVLFGLIVAVLADRSSMEKIGKTLVFLPMGISMVGAGVIWKFIYAYRPMGAEQIGLLNAVVTAFGLEPMNWLGSAPMNNAFLILIFVWPWTGFALVVLSAALKAVPTDMLEAARIDGAGEWVVLLRIILPSILGSIITVSTTILLAALKSFDIVFSMTNGLYGTEVLASQQYKQMFKFLHYGRGSAIAILILIAVSPVIYYNLKEFSKREVF
ncbi:MAG: Lactose transport system permease protein LacF [Spirochaetes bacterium ADurb.Bin269]|nr:MAG: Lactose transport system permease protein LacF [Spirochaetes bacterium ADurb.Bin269]